MKQRVIALALGVLVGAVIAAVVVQVVPRQATMGIFAGTSTGQGIVMPTLEEIKSARASSNDGEVNANDIPPDEEEFIDAGGGSGGSSGGGSGGSGSGGGGYSPNDYFPDDTGGSGDSGQNYCPQSRAENPVLYDSCRAGYVPPTIQFGGVTSCYPIDKNAGIWSITWTWRAVGGNWNGVWNGGQTFTSNYYTSPGEAHSGPILIGESISITILDMNGWGYKIDEVHGTFGGVQMNTVCR